jgi:hypothetical protein
MKLRWTRPALAAKIWFEGQNYIARDNQTQLERSRNSGLLQALLQAWRWFESYGAARLDVDHSPILRISSFSRFS